MPKRTEDNIKVGGAFTNNQGENYTIVSIKNLKEITILFDGYTQIKVIRKSAIQSGMVKNQYKPVVHGVGYIGEGRYSAKSNSRIHNVWSNMLARCYDEDKREYGRYGGRGIYVDSDWHNFQNFSSWFNEFYKEGFELDKDMKCGVSECYSEETCTFIPPRINKLLLSSNAKRSKYGIGVSLRKNGSFQASFSKDGGKVTVGTYSTSMEAFLAYKTAKESYIKEVALEYKDVIPEEAFKTLMDWEVIRFPL